MSGNRFDYVKYDEEAMQTQQLAKDLTCRLEAFIEQCVKCPRSRALALTKLEEAYMWIGKGVRNDQIVRSSVAPLNEERGN